MSEMVERVARAIYEAEARVEGVHSSWEEIKERLDRDGYPYAKLAYAKSLDAARAAIEAMREAEPTEAMMGAMWSLKFTNTRDSFRECFGAVLDASLREGDAER